MSPWNILGPFTSLLLLSRAQEGIAGAPSVPNRSSFLKSGFIYLFIYIFLEKKAAERNAVKKLDTGHVLTSNDLRVFADAWTSQSLLSTNPGGRK